MLFLPGFRNIHPCISPQTLDCFLHILRKGKRGESIQANKNYNFHIKIKQHHQADCHLKLQLYENIQHSAKEEIS
jgi:hypothetical protein